MSPISRRKLLKSFIAGGIGLSILNRNNTNTQTNTRYIPNIASIQTEPDAQVSITVSKESIIINTTQATLPRCLSLGVYSYTSGKLLSHSTAITADGQTKSSQFSNVLTSVPQDVPVSFVLFNTRSESYLSETDPMLKDTKGQVRLFDDHLPSSVVYDYESTTVINDITINTNNGHYEIVFTPSKTHYMQSKYADPIKISVSKVSYRNYKQGMFRSPGFEFTRAKSNPHVKQVFNSIRQSNLSDDQASLFHFVTNFVQTMPYDYDTNTSPLPDYAQTPTEYLVNGTGDCEDKTILLGALLSQPQLDMKPIMLFLPGHSALGIPIERLYDIDVIAAEDTYETITHEDVEYIYLESVDSNTFGEISVYPEEVSFSKNILVSIYDGEYTNLNPLAFEEAPVKKQTVLTETLQV